MKNESHGAGPRRNLAAIDDFLYEIDELEFTKEMPAQLVGLFEQAKFGCAYLDGFIREGEKKNG